MSGDSFDTALRRPTGRVVGAKQSLRELKMGRVTAVFVARDAETAVIAEVLRVAGERSLPIRYLDTMAMLGRACGIQVGAACAAVLTDSAGGSPGGRTQD
ncbi:MAG: ribosomal L7Ae/L30e/S12e/Gadd45 family protein [Clostridia bacterium]